MTVPSNHLANMDTFPTATGFRNGTASVHTSRTIMFDEVAQLFGRVAQTDKQDRYSAAVIEDNVLGKPTRTTRLRTYQRLAELYALDPKVAVFRILRLVWAAEPLARPMTAYLVAMARDPLLREMTPFVVGRSAGAVVHVEEIRKHLQEQHPQRFGSSTATATAQRLASSWCQAGYLKGKVKKVRAEFVIPPVVAAVALAFGYLTGRKGNRLLDTPWVAALGRTPDELIALAEEASHQGWLTYRSAGAVVDITFPALITPAEEKGIHEPN